MGEILISLCKRVKNSIHTFCIKKIRKLVVTVHTFIVVRMHAAIVKVHAVYEKVIAFFCRSLHTFLKVHPICFNKAKKSGMDGDRASYLDIEQMVKHELRDAERVYVNGIESGNNKPFWKYVKSQKKQKNLLSLLLKRDYRYYIKS